MKLGYGAKPHLKNLCVGKGSENPNKGGRQKARKFVNWTNLDANLDFLKAFSKPGMKGFWVV